MASWMVLSVLDLAALGRSLQVVLGASMVGGIVPTRGCSRWSVILGTSILILVLKNCTTIHVVGCEAVKSCVKV